MNVNYRVGNLLSNDLFYDDSGSTLDWQKLGVLAVEMESAALYLNAARAGKNALAICTISDHLSKNESLDAQARRELQTVPLDGSAADRPGEEPRAARKHLRARLARRAAVGGDERDEHAVAPGLLLARDLGENLLHKAPPSAAHRRGHFFWDEYTSFVRKKQPAGGKRWT